MAERRHTRQACEVCGDQMPAAGTLCVPATPPSPEGAHDEREEQRPTRSYEVRSLWVDRQGRTWTLR